MHNNMNYINLRCNTASLQQMANFPSIWIYKYRYTYMTIIYCAATGIPLQYHALYMYSCDHMGHTVLS